MYRIAIAEDQDSDAQQLETALKTYSREMRVPCSRDHWTSGEIFLQKYRHQCDIVCLDIRLLVFQTFLAASGGLREKRRIKRY